MTTPGGVPNLPWGALTLDTLASDLQDMTGPAMRSRAVARFPSIFNTSTGLNPAVDLTPFGILTAIWAEVNSLIANADPADIQGPQDLPPLLLQFIEGLPVVGQLVGLLEAILGTYTGDDPVLLQVQTIFAPIRAIVDTLTVVSGGTGGLGNFFPDLLGLLGNPTGLGSGTVGLPGVGSIPLLGGLFGGGGTLLTSLIPGLDATKIVSGAFPISMITNLSTLLTGFGTSTSILTQLIGVIPGLTGGLTGLTGLGSIFTDLTGLLGSPTALGSGTPVLPGIGSIPLLGGLLSGGNILGSLIPGLDASKIITGVFGLGFIPSLPASQITSGTFGTGLIPGLDVSKIITGVFGAGFIPGLDTSKITSGTFGNSLIPGIGLLQDALAQALVGGSSTGYTPANLKSFFQSFPGGNIVGSIASSLLSGTIGAGLIPGLDASKIITGTFGTGLIPNLPASIITSGTFGTSLIPSLAASIITSGTFGAGLIPGLDASKIVSGILGTGQIPDVTLGMSSAVQALVDNAYQAMNGGSTTGHTLASFKTSLLNVPGANVISALGASVIPVLDASKITSGVFGTGLIPSLPASIINSGTFGTSRIPNITTAMSSDMQTGFKNISDKWFNVTTATGTPAEVATAIDSIRKTVLGGYTVEVITSNQTWTRPFALTELWAGPINGGGKGAIGAGTNNVAPALGGLGGSSGGYIMQQLDPAAVTDPVTCTIGTGQTVTNGADGSVTSFGTYVSGASNAAGEGTVFGYRQTASKPGVGGTGGSVNTAGAKGTDGAKGDSTPLAAGGAGGAGTIGTGAGTAGSNGAAASTTGLSKAGGGGGGGGGSRENSTGSSTGGTGGAGGFPGGGGGGGGAGLAPTGVGGPGGNGANGALILIYK